MGYFINGFAFSAAPDFGAIANALPGFSMLGYRHIKHPLWLLDLWETSRRQDHPPFTIPTNLKPFLELPLVSEKQFVVKTLSLIESKLKDELTVYGSDEVRAASAISQLAGPPTLLFKADDETYDFACLAGHTLLRAEYSMELLKVIVQDGHIAVEQIVNIEDDPFDDPTEELIGLAGIEVRAPVEIDGGSPLYGCVLAVWPKEFANPVESLGFGTPDPLEHFKRDFTVVFERLAN